MVDVVYLKCLVIVGAPKMLAVFISFCEICVRFFSFLSYTYIRLFSLMLILNYSYSLKHFLKTEVN